MNSDSKYGSFVVLANFYDPSALLGHASIKTYLLNLGSLSTWTRKGRRVTAPANAASMELQYLLYQSSGWVNIDDVEVTIVPPNAATEVTKYYYFGGQRVAMRKNGVLTYLHSDHLGSTVLTTNTNGSYQSSDKYFAYGKDREPASNVPTDHKFTGQKLDASGLQYFNARFYDPVIGIFVSPDTIVPDAGNVFDYNRYMYVRGRVMNANDPSGHLTQEEIENYFGVSTQEELAKTYGEAIAELLFEPYVTWGDVLDYEGGSAALMLFYNNGTYQGGFWGITGDAAGTPVSSYALSQSKKTSRNIESSKNLHNGTLAIPRRMAPKGEYYQYYFLKQTDYGVKNYALLATDTIMGIWTIADVACQSSGGKCTVPPAPRWLQVSSVLLTAEGYFSGSNWYDTYYKVHPAHYDRGPSALTADQMINQNMLTRPTGTYEERKSE